MRRLTIACALLCVATMQFFLPLPAHAWDGCWPSNDQEAGRAGFSSMAHAEYCERLSELEEKYFGTNGPKQPFNGDEAALRLVFDELDKANCPIAGEMMRKRSCNKPCHDKSL